MEDRAGNAGATVSTGSVDAPARRSLRLAECVFALPSAGAMGEWMEQHIDEHKRQALADFSFRSAVPLFRSTGDGADHLATGIFFAVGSHLLLVTARHVLDEYAPEDIAITTSPEGSPLRTLGNLIIHRPVDVPGAEIDVVAIEILDDETKRIASGGWRIVDPSIGDDAKGTGELLVIGYPSRTLRFVGKNMTGRPTGIITALSATMPHDACPPANPALDLFLQLPRKAFVADGSIIDIPPIKGMSGCAIWEARKVDDGELWSADRAHRLIGIQSSSRPDHYLRGKNWSHLKALLAEVEGGRVSD